MTKKDLNEKTGDFLLDVAKMFIAGVVLASIFDDKMSKTAIVYGVISTAAFVVVGYYFLFKSLKK